MVGWIEVFILSREKPTMRPQRIAVTRGMEYLAAVEMEFPPIVGKGELRIINRILPLPYQNIPMCLMIPTEFLTYSMKRIQ